MIKDLLTLGDTVELMNSADYRDRFVAEYIQTALRLEKLTAFNNKLTAADLTQSLEPEHDCPAELLFDQEDAMREYLRILETRAVIEDIDLADAIASLVRKHQKPCCVTHEIKCENGIYGETTLKKRG